MQCLEEPKCRILSLLCKGICGIQRCHYRMCKCHIQFQVKHEGTLFDLIANVMHRKVKQF